MNPYLFPSVVVPTLLLVYPSPFWSLLEWCLWDDCVGKNSTGQRGHNIVFEFAHTHLGLGVSEYHLGQLKAKIAKLRTQLLEPPKVPYLACITWEWLKLLEVKQTCISCVSQYVL
jgi:hypothetical protein